MDYKFSWGELKNSNKIKVVCISDTHTRTDSLILLPGDILIHSGIFTFSGLKSEIVKFNDF